MVEHSLNIVTTEGKATTVPHGGQSKSLWDCNYSRWGLELSAEHRLAIRISHGKMQACDPRLKVKKMPVNSTTTKVRNESIFFFF